MPMTNTRPSKAPKTTFPNTIEREADEVELHLMSLKKALRGKRISLSEMCFGSDEAAEAAFNLIMRKYS